MDLAATLTECAIDATRESVPAGAAMVWLVPADGNTISIMFPVATRWTVDQWLAYIGQRLETYVKQVVLQLEPTPISLAHLTAASAQYTPVPIGLAVLLPVHGGRVLEVVGHTGNAIRMAFTSNAANVGIVQRTVKREVSLAAYLLELARGTDSTSGTPQAFLN